MTLTPDQIAIASGQNLALMIDFISQLSDAYAAMVSRDPGTVSTIPIIDIGGITFDPPPDLPSIDIPDPNITLPPEPSVAFSFQDRAYNSHIRDTLETLLIERVREGGRGYGAEAEQASFDLTKEKDLRKLLDDTDDAARDWAKYGFNRPDGELNKKVTDAHLLVQDTRMKDSVDLAIKQSNIAEKQSEFLMETLNKYNASKGSGWNRTQNRLLDAAKAMPEMAVNILRARISAINVIISVYNAVVQKVDAVSEIYQAQIQGYLAKVEGKVSINEVGAELYGVEAERYKIEVDKYSKLLDILVKEATKLSSLMIEAIQLRGHIEGQLQAAIITSVQFTTGYHSSTEGVFSRTGEATYRMNENGDDVIRETVE